MQQILTVHNLYIFTNLDMYTHTKQYTIQYYDYFISDNIKDWFQCTIDNTDDIKHKYKFNRSLKAMISWQILQAILIGIITVTLIIK